MKALSRFALIHCSPTSGNGLNGTAVNMPARAMTGHNWTGGEIDFRRVPEEYGTIPFHDDDMTDARWDVAFAYTIPEDLPSGIYAARLAMDSGNPKALWSSYISEALLWVSRRAPSAFA